jgi:hypothetical protein
MKKNSQSSITEVRWVRNLTSVVLSTVFILEMILYAGCVDTKEKDSFANTIQAYQVKWWGTSGSLRSRPPSGVINIDNDKLTVRYTIQEGRALSDYRLPYWGVSSFVSIFSKSAEIAHHGSVNLTIDGKKMSFPLRIGNEKYRSADVNRIDSMSLLQIGKGFELTRFKKADVLKVTCLSDGSPILIENFFVINKGSNIIPVLIRATNLSDKTIQDAEVKISYAQDFNWSSFGTSNTKNYQEIKAPSNNMAKAFFAFSSGMESGFEFRQIDGCELNFILNDELNAWKVNIQNIPKELSPGSSILFQYHIRIIDNIPDEPLISKVISYQKLGKFVFTNLKLTEVKNAPVNPEGQVTIQNVIQNLNKPKVRGLNLRAGFSNSLNDLETLKEWGGNLIITEMVTPGETRKTVERGHELGIEMFIPGENSYSTGIPPSFDKFFQGNLRPTEYPDSYGQDEDHYYWYPVKPTINFEAEFGKQMSKASMEEKVIYWSRCFVDKWRKTLTDVREHDPEGNIWFYMPAPSVANIDPFDYYDLFFKEISQLNDALTVFPFYYGADYNQVEYMMRRWKAAGTKRAVFLPMRWYMAKPSQYIRAITAARRGGADGSCGFNFAVSEEEPGKEWQWKSVMLAAQANFPSPELKAYCFIEEPAELIESLAIKDLIIVSTESDTEEFFQKLKKLLPGQVQGIKNLPENYSKSDKMYVVIGNDAALDKNTWVYDVGQPEEGINKGIMQMSGSVVRLDGTNTNGLKNAKELFLRFAELALAESRQ